MISTAVINRRRTLSMQHSHVDIQHCASSSECPDAEEIASWVDSVVTDEFKGRSIQVELTVRLVDKQESSELNQQYRQKTGPTNVLSFPFEAPPGYPETTDYRLLGDIVICAPLVQQEAAQQRKTPRAHWAHLVVHGVLHLLGYDHQTTPQAEQMEQREILLLAHFNIANPYQPQACAPTTGAVQAGN